MAAGTRTEANRRYAERKRLRLALGELREAVPAVAAPALPGAACKTEPPELWFPDEGDDGAKAIAICLRCPSRAQCLEGAIARGEDSGIWGGQNLELEHAGGARRNARAS